MNAVINVSVDIELVGDEPRELRQILDCHYEKGGIVLHQNVLWDTLRTPLQRGQREFTFSETFCCFLKTLFENSEWEREPVVQSILGAVDQVLELGREKP